MADRYLHFTGTAPGRFLTRRLGLPQPAPLRRWSWETPALDGPLLHLTAGDSTVTKELGALLAATCLEVTGRADRPAGIVLDATAVVTPGGLAGVHAALHPVVRSLAPGGRVVVLGVRPSADDHHQAAAQQALEGFVRSLGKEIGRGATVQLLRIAPEGVAGAESTLRFLLSSRSAYISGQAIELTSAAPDPVADRAAPLAGRTALVTGAARGIGASVVDVNLDSVLRTTDALLKAGTVNRGGRIVATASIAGIAGNNGQTNYAASKAGIIGLVRALAPRAAADHGVTVNAVAPGFIETKMTAAAPLFIREAGRRMNSLSQGGLPVDVAETTAWFAQPASTAVNGQIVRVCGQSLLGA
ncbi:SDR family oxidoreductase [Streptomyces sp. NPDC058240]|uniref:SDR family oxidoreductase n=1 Tax=Streptomyces sp. NPDC058240 TaxID=3346396 RepID=UPI0036E21A45